MLVLLLSAGRFLLGVRPRRVKRDETRPSGTLSRERNKACMHTARRPGLA